VVGSTLAAVTEVDGIDRRDLVLGFLALTIVAGCGGGSSPTAAKTTTTLPATSSPSSSSTATTAPSTSRATVPADQRIPDDVLASDAQGYNGTWSATFTHADGTSGPLSVNVAIDAAARTASVTINIGAGFFGPGAAAASETKTYNIDDIGWDQQHFEGSSTLFGTGMLDRPSIGSGQVEIKGTQLPGRPDVASIDIQASRLNFVEPHPFAYTITRTDGSTITGTATFAQ
jgi:hypothetical protein